MQNHSLRRTGESITRMCFKQTTHFIKINNHIAIDLFRTELLSILTLNLNRALLSEFSILLRTVLQMRLLLISQLSHKLGRITRPQLQMKTTRHDNLSRRDLLSSLNDGSSTHHRIRTHVASLLKNGSHTNQRVIVNRAGVQHRSVSNRDVVTESARSIARMVLLCRNNNRSVLNVGILSDSDAVLVS